MARANTASQDADAERDGGLFEQEWSNGPIEIHARYTHLPRSGRSPVDTVSGNVAVAKMGWRALSESENIGGNETVGGKEVKTQLARRKAQGGGDNGRFCLFLGYDRKPWGFADGERKAEMDMWLAGARGVAGFTRAEILWNQGGAIPRAPAGNASQKLWRKVLVPSTGRAVVLSWFV